MTHSVQSLHLSLCQRFDADFQFTYGDSIAETGTKLDDPLARKKRLALAAVSNCDFSPAAVVRLQYLKVLRERGLRLDAIGDCFDKSPIPRVDYLRNAMVEYTSRYKFYFAFENSYHCKDYVTEKFFRAIKAGAVPVVWGAKRAAYEAYVPASGFIFVEDFPSMQRLIDRLNYLDRNDTAYLEYFRCASLYVNVSSDKFYCCPKLLYSQRCYSR